MQLFQKTDTQSSFNLLMTCGLKGKTPPLSSRHTRSHARTHTRTHTHQQQQLAKPPADIGAGNITVLFTPDAVQMMILDSYSWKLLSWVVWNVSEIFSKRRAFRGDSDVIVSVPLKTQPASRSRLCDLVT